jgi:uncharacterized membrane protein SirB2
MLEFYPQIRLFHISCVLLSGSLFCLRGLLMLAGSAQANHVVLRWLSYAIDSALLTAALMLMTLLHQYPLQQSWLTVKVLLIVFYVLLGAFALRRAKTYRVRATCFAAAVLVYLFVISVARAHDPLGALRGQFLKGFQFHSSPGIARRAPSSNRA